VGPILEPPIGLQALPGTESAAVNGGERRQASCQHSRVVEHLLVAQRHAGCSSRDACNCSSAAAEPGRATAARTAEAATAAPHKGRPLATSSDQEAFPRSHCWPHIQHTRGSRCNREETGNRGKPQASKHATHACDCWCRGSYYWRTWVSDHRGILKSSMCYGMLPVRSHSTCLHACLPH